MKNCIAFGVSALLLFTLAVPGAPSFAQQGDVYVPDELEPWRDWVMHGKEFLGCPFFFDQRGGRDSFICAWPGELELTVTVESGRFTQVWTVYEDEQWVPIPGDRELWPEQVTADGQAVEVVMRDALSFVRLGPGQHTMAGRFAWDERPRTLPVPPASGLLRLTVDGKRIARPERNRNAVWLGEREAVEQAADAIEVQVYRVVTDDVPTRLTTIFRIEVAGGMREELLGPALPAGFVPMALQSALPARLETNGDLRLQVRPGSWQVELHARSTEVLQAITLAPPGHNLPGTEIWSYRSNDRLRVTVAEGLAPVDPTQVSVPPEYRQLPAFRIAPGDVLEIVERSRGKMARDNQLHLRRLLWLDFDGGGFTFSDVISGTMQSGWRLDMAQPYQLLSASQNDADLLVTRGTDEALSGVELRRTNVMLAAIGRAETRERLPASGWQTRLAGMTAELNLPPGNKLIAAGGADSASRAWVERWQLLDFFLVLIITLATARLFGWQGGVVAFFALVLSWHESGAPHWAWLNLLAAAALVRVAPAGRLRAAALAWRGISVIAVVLLLVPFFANQLRIGIYPQLEPQYGAPVAMRAEAPPPAPYPAAEPASKRQSVRPAQEDFAADSVREIIVTGTLSRYARYAPNAIVQAGPGRPSWRWNSYDLNWSGPVDPDRMLNLVIMPRWLVSALRFLEVALLAILAAVFVFETLRLDWRWPPRWRRGSGTSAPLSLLFGGALIAGATLLAVPAAKADTPSPEILKQLEQRLLEPPPCVPRCAEVVEAKIDVQQEVLSIELTVHALEHVALPLPGSLAGWRPESVRIDGAPAREVYRRADETLWVPAPAGSHRIELAGPLPPVDSVEVPFPAVPRVVTARAEGWALDGIDDRRLQTGSLQLTRERADDAADNGAVGRWESSRFPEFVRIERLVELDLDWRVHTRVTRVAPQQGAITLAIPLLEGASLLTADLPVTDGEVRVSIRPSEETVEWESMLPRTSPLVLEVPGAAPWKEVWRFGIGNIWHASFSGVPESEAAEAAEGARVAEFYPRGGESLTLTAGRPAAIGGTTLAFDAAAVMTDVGARSRTVTMTLGYRSTRGAQHLVRLPAGAEILEVSIDGRNQPLRADQGELSLPILPGEHEIEVRWQRDVEIDARVATPPVDLGAAASNITLGIDLPANRWVLTTSGPRLGPAILYWSELAAMILFALILGRTSLTPLRTHHWLLLVAGFSTFSWPVLVLVAVWLLAVGARGRWRIPDNVSWWRFDAVQILIALLTIAALVAIVIAVPSGLLGSPDMHVAGNNSHGNNLFWFADRSASLLPTASAISLPLWVYKALILAWALWLSFALLRWLRWAWQCFASHGFWRGRTNVSI